MREFGLRITQEDEQSALKALISSNNGCEVVISIADTQKDVRKDDKIEKERGASVESSSSRQQAATESGRHRHAGG